MKFLLRLLALMLLLVVMAMTLARRENSGAWIVYTARDADYYNGIRLMTGNGRSTWKITPDGLCASTPKWSPNGKWIAAYATDCAGGPLQLVRMRLGATRTQLIASALPPSGNDFVWSPDGSHMIVVAELAVVYELGSDINILQSFEARYTVPQWSPDGEWIYTGYLGEGSALGRTHPDIIHFERLRAIHSRILYFDWSPDGTQLVLTTDSDPAPLLYFMNPDGSNLRVIVIDLPAQRIDNPIWSPDGVWIAFKARIEGTHSPIYRIRPNGHDLQLLADIDFVSYDMQWSPDSQWLLFTGRSIPGPHHIYRLPADGSPMENLQEGTSPEYAPVSGREWNPFGLTITALGMMILSIIGRLRR